MYMKNAHNSEMSLPFAGSTALFMLMLHRYGRTVWMDRPSGSTKSADARTPPFTTWCSTAVSFTKLVAKEEKYGVTDQL